MKEITKKGIFINLDKNYFKNEEDVLNSTLFHNLLTKFITKIERKKVSFFKDFDKAYLSTDEKVETIIDIFKLCLIFDYSKFEKEYLISRNNLLTFVEELYNYYRKYERYVFVEIKDSNNKTYETRELLEKDHHYNDLILKLYRRISENIMGYSNLVYRQLNVGSNAGFLLDECPFKFKNEYSILNNVRTIDSLILHPPFIIYPENTKRTGIFGSCPKHPLEYLNNVNLDNFLLYPIYIGKYKAFVYFNMEFASLGVSLANLFAPIRSEDINETPDIVLFYGVDNKELDLPYYYNDEKNGMYVGITPCNTEMTYFGYLKKILLTLHNLKCIDNNEIPLHGAMVSIKLVDGSKTNICMIGDSGAGKSETLEALKEIMDDDISEMITVFDDMGYMNSKLEFFGTETGAFVRMDDLDKGYAYKEIDRAIFMNPDRANARTIIPVTTLEEINKPHDIDLFLYANNYEEKNGIDIFNTPEEALAVFKLGKRKAKGTTSEQGLVSSYFANPFGPVQRQEKMDILLDNYFNKLYDSKVPVGQIYTRLGTKSFTKEDLIQAAKSLIKYIKK